MAFTPLPALLPVGNIAALLGGNRLEPRPRSVEFSRNLRAEVRDAAWMLARQWQMKEFQAEDRGKPAQAQVEMETALLNQVKLTGGQGPNVPAVPYTHSLPLDALVQAQPLVIDTGLRLEMGQYWSLLLRSLPVPASDRITLLGAYRTAFPLAVPSATVGDYDLDYFLASSAEEAFEALQLAALQLPDGYALYQYLLADGATAATAIGNNALVEPLTTLGTRFVAWFRKAYVQPAATAWSVAGLDHEFAVAAPTKTVNPVVLGTNEYQGGELNWYGLDESSVTGFSNLSNGVQTINQTFMPTEIQFAGSPSARWWEFEDGKIDLGHLQGDPSDLSRMLLQEFIFLYQNDWFSLPYTVLVGSISSVKKLVVTDVFGQKYEIQPAGNSSLYEAAVGNATALPIDKDWGRWSVFAQSAANNRQPTQLRVLVPPTSVGALTGPVVERVSFMREESTNLVWGIEQTIPDGLGRGLDAAGAGNQVSEYLRSRATPEALPASQSTEEFSLFTTVPENWIPFLPLQVPNSTEYTLEQGVMPRHVRGLALQAADSVVQPRSPLLNLLPPSEPYRLHERVVPPTGLRVDGNYHRTRWYNGQTSIWYGYHQGPRPLGGGASGLAFDQLTPRTPPASGTGNYGLVAASFAAGQLELARLYELDEQNQVKDGPVLELTREQVVTLLQAQNQVKTLRRDGPNSWQVVSPVVLRTVGENYILRLTTTVEDAGPDDMLGTLLLI